MFGDVVCLRFLFVFFLFRSFGHGGMLHLFLNGDGCNSVCYIVNTVWNFHNQLLAETHSTTLP